MAEETYMTPDAEDQNVVADPPSKSQDLYRNLIADGYDAAKLGGSEEAFVGKMKDRATATKLYNHLLDDGYDANRLGGNAGNFGNMMTGKSLQATVSVSPDETTLMNDQAAAGFQDPVFNTDFMKYAEARKEHDRVVDHGPSLTPDYNGAMATTKKNAEESFTKNWGAKNKEFEGLYADTKDIALPDMIDFSALENTKKSNPALYERQLANYSWYNPLIKAIAEKDPENAGAVASQIARYQQAKTGEEYSTAVQESDDIRALIYKYIDDMPTQNKMIASLGKDRGKSFGDQLLFGDGEEMRDSPFAGKISRTQQVGLDYIKAFDPGTGQQIEFTLQGDKPVWGQEGIQAWESQMKLIEDKGMQLAQQTSEELLNDLNKKPKEDLTTEDIAVFNRLADKSEEMASMARTQEQRYPLTYANMIDTLTQEAVGAKKNKAQQFVMKLGWNGTQAILNLLDDATTSVFGSEEDKRSFQLRQIGDQNWFDTQVYQREAERLFQPEVKTDFSEFDPELGAIMNSDMKEDQKREAVRQVISRNISKVKYIAQDPKLNVSAKSFLNATSDVFGQVLPMLAVGILTDGAGVASELSANSGRLAEMKTIFKGTFLTSYENFKTQHLRENRPDADTRAFIDATTEALSEMFPGDLTMLKRAFGKTGGVFGKVVEGITEAEWKAAVAKGAKVGNLKKVFKSLGSAALSNQVDVLKEAASEGVGDMLNNLAKNSLLGEDNQVIGTGGESFATTFVGMQAQALLGLPFKVGPIAMDTKHQVWEFGVQPDKYKEYFSDQYKKGEIDSKELDSWNGIIARSVKAVENVPSQKANGAPLSDLQKSRLAFNNYTKQDVASTPDAGTSSIKELKEKVTAQADAENEEILSGRDDEKLKAEASAAQPEAVQEEGQPSVRDDVDELKSYARDLQDELNLDPGNLEFQAELQSTQSKIGELEKQINDEAAQKDTPGQTPETGAAEQQGTTESGGGSNPSGGVSEPGTIESTTDGEPQSTQPEEDDVEQEPNIKAIESTATYSERVSEEELIQAEARATELIDSIPVPESPEAAPAQPEPAQPASEAPISRNYNTGEVSQSKYNGEEFDSPTQETEWRVANSENPGEIADAWMTMDEADPAQKKVKDAAAAKFEQLTGVPVDTVENGQRLARVAAEQFWDDVRFQQRQATPRSEPTKVARVVKAIRNTFKGVKGFGIKTLGGNEWSDAVAEAKRVATQGGDLNFNFVGERTLFQKARKTLNAAQDMANQGTPEEEIFDQTGWYRDRNDGKWRYELPDSNINFTFNDQPGTYKLGDILDFPALYESNPEARNLKVVAEPMTENKGSYNPITNEIKLDTNGSGKEQYKTLRHEVQHYIQHSSGMARGGSLLSGRARVGAEIRRLGAQAGQRRRDAATAATQGRPTIQIDRELEAIEKDLEALKSNPDGYADYFYKATAGEIEARNVEKRIDHNFRYASPNATADKFRPQDITVNFMYTPKGQVYGFAVGNQIYLNADALNTNTPIHEASHIFLKWAKTNRPELYAAGMQLIDENNPYYQNVSFSNFYQQQAEAMRENGATNDEVDEFFKDEALAAAVGDKGSQIISDRNGFQQWLKNLWESIRDFFGGKTYDKMSYEDFMDLKFDDFARGMAERIVSGQELQGDVTGENITFNANDIYGRIKQYAQRVESGRVESKRLHPDAEHGRIRGGSRVLEASKLLGTVDGTAGQGERTAPIEGKQGQEKALEDYAKAEGIWFGDAMQVLDDGDEGTTIEGLGTYGNRGMEAQVFFGNEKYPGKVVKVIRTALPAPIKTVEGKEHGLPMAFLDERIALHNAFASEGKTNPETPDTALELIGFGRDAEGEFVAVVTQAEIPEFNETPWETIEQDMANRGYEQDGSVFHNAEVEIHDLHEGNVLTDSKGNLQYIDTIILPKYPVNENGFPDVRFQAEEQAHPFFGAEKQQILDEQRAKAGDRTEAQEKLSRDKFKNIEATADKGPGFFSKFWQKFKNFSVQLDNPNRYITELQEAVHEYYDHPLSKIPLGRVMEQNSQGKAAAEVEDLIRDTFTDLKRKSPLGRKNLMEDFNAYVTALRVQDRLAQQKLEENRLAEAQRDQRENEQEAESQQILLDDMTERLPQVESEMAAAYEDVKKATEYLAGIPEDMTDPEVYDAATQAVLSAKTRHAAIADEYVDLKRNIKSSEVLIKQAKANARAASSRANIAEADLSNRQVGGITFADAQTVISDIEAAGLKEDFDARAEMMQRYSNRMLLRLRSAEVISKEQYADIKRKNDFYAPFSVIHEKQRVHARNSNINTAANIVKKIKGISNRINLTGVTGLDQLTALYADKQITPDEYYDAYTAVLDDLRSKGTINEDEYSEHLNEITEMGFTMGNVLNRFANMVYDSFRITERNKFMLRMEKLAAIDAEGMFAVSVSADPRTLGTTEVPIGMTGVPYYNKGKKKLLAVNGAAAKALLQMNDKELNWFTKNLNRFNSLLRAGAITFSPKFLIKNLLIDTVRNATLSKYGLVAGNNVLGRLANTLYFVPQYVEAILVTLWENMGRPVANVFAKNKIGHTEFYKEFMKSGAFGHGWFDQLFSSKEEGKPAALRELQNRTIGESIKKTLSIITLLGPIGKSLEEAHKLVNLQRGLDIEGVKRVGISRLKNTVSAMKTPEDVSAAIDAVAYEVQNIAGSPNFQAASPALKSMSLALQFFSARVKGVMSDMRRIGNMAGFNVEGVKLTAQERGTLLANTMLVTLPIVLTAILNHSDDDDEDELKKNVSEFDRNKNVLVKFGTFTDDAGKDRPNYIKFPVRDIPAIINHAANYGAEYLKHKDPKSLKMMAAKIIGEVSPLDLEFEHGSERFWQSIISSSTPIPKYAFEAGSDINTRYGRALLGYRLKREIEEGKIEKYEAVKKRPNGKVTTPQWAIDLAKILHDDLGMDATPIMLNHADDVILGNMIDNARNSFLGTVMNGTFLRSKSDYAVYENSEDKKDNKK